MWVRQDMMGCTAILPKDVIYTDIGGLGSSICQVNEGCCLCITEPLQCKWGDALVDVIQDVDIMKFVHFRLQMKSSQIMYCTYMLALCASQRKASRTYMQLLSVCALLNTFQNVGRGSPSVIPHQLYMLVSLMPVMAGAWLGIAISNGCHVGVP